jgi:hypothetical protein
MHTKTSESTISHFVLFILFMGRDSGIFGTAADMATLKRINVCITAFSHQRLIFGTFGTRRRPGRDLTGIGYPKGVDPTTPRLPTATIRLSFEIFFYNVQFFSSCLLSHSLATYILKGLESLKNHCSKTISI